MSGAGLQDLVAAVKAKDGPRVSKLLHAGADPSGRDANGMTPLHYASSAGDSTSAMLLVAAGADPNAKDPAGLTPLHDAAAAGSREVANILLASGADARVITRAGLTPAGEASRNHHDALASFLRSRELLPPKPAAPPRGAPPVAPEPGKSALPKGAGDQMRRVFEAGDWTEDIQASQQFSKETQRPVLVLFTGSDWCHFCKLLEAQVLSTTTFRDEARGRYILLYVDFPRSNKPSKEVQAQRMNLAEKYGVRAYPTLVILQDGDRELGRIRGFKQGMTTEKYLSAIREIAP